IILWISLFLGDTILQLFGISIDSFRIAGGILVVTIAMSM
ncbi:MarC family protein, partial [Escherichia coli]